MIAKVYSAIPDGYTGQIIEVEGNVTRSLPMFNIVGMANKTITESRERIRAALMSTNFKFPDQRITINLAPAEVTKTGSHLDLPIALVVLVLSQQLLPSDLEHRFFVGELSLDGFTRPVRGIINIIETAKSAGFTEIYLPSANLPQASLISGVHLYGVDNLSALILHLKGVKPLPEASAQVLSGTPAQTPPKASTQVLSGIPARASTSGPPQDSTLGPYQAPAASKPLPLATPLLDHIKGQTFAKRALIIAVAGHHNLLFSGPPGSGKTFLAKVAANLLPAPTQSEQIAITKIHSLDAPLDHVITTRPFRSPHHSASAAAIIGGGPQASPGEISLAHHGVLFLDELPEFSRYVIEALRQPLEDHTISISRVNHHAVYPANFMLIATMNPCPCGYHSDPSHQCTCTPQQIQAYREKLSGPIMDRIDLTVNVERINNTDLFPAAQTASAPECHTSAPASAPPSLASAPEHAAAKQAIANAILRQHERYGNDTIYNSSLSSQELFTYLSLHPKAKSLLNQASDTLHLSVRAYIKTIKVASTIADLAESPLIRAEHISEALSFREQIN